MADNTGRTPGPTFKPCRNCGHGKTFHHSLGFCRAFVRTGTDSLGYPKGTSCGCEQYAAASVTPSGAGRHGR